MANTGCPPQTQWQNFLLGRADDGEVHFLEEHLRKCPSCLETLHDLQTEDSLIEAMRQPVQKPDADQIALLERLARRRAEIAQTSGDANGQAETPPVLENTKELINFLHPAQEPDELGRLGGYRILKVLGAGGMGIVFQAEDPQLKRLVALKALKPLLAASAAAGRRFEREAQAAAAIKHDNVITIYQVGVDNGIPFLAMELLEGESLDHRLDRDKNLSVSDILRIGREIAEGLAAAHERGLIHRDIKPGNIWLEKTRDRVKVLDFGLVHASGQDAKITREGAIIGTPAYMAPEQAQGGKVDARADLFSLGCVLYRMAIGEPPFHGPDAISTLYAIGTQLPVPPVELNPTLPLALSSVILRLLAKKPEDRPESAQLVADTLGEIERNPQSVGTTENPKNGGHRRKAWSLAVVVGLLLPLAWFFGGTIVRFATNKGELVIDVRDSDVVVTVTQKKVLIVDKSAQRTFEIDAGDGEVLVFEKDGVGPIATRIFSLNRAGKTTVVVTLHELAEGKKAIKASQKRKPPANEPKSKNTQKEPASPLDVLRREDISAKDLEAIGGGDQVKAPVAVVAFWKSGYTTGDSFYRPDGYFSADGTQFFSSSVSAVFRWDLTKAGARSVVGEQDKSLLRMSIDSKGVRCAASTHWGKNKVSVWDVPSGKSIREFSGERFHDVVMSLSPDGKLLATAGIVGKKARNLKISVWEVDSGDLKQEIDLGTTANGFFALKFSPDGKQLISALCEGRFCKVHVWDFDTGKNRLLQTVPLNAIAQNCCLALSPSGGVIAVGGQSPFLAILDGNSGKVLSNPITDDRSKQTLPGLAFSSDGKSLASLHPTSSDGTKVKVWEVASGQLKESISLPGAMGLDECQSVAWHPDGRHLALVTHKGNVLILRLAEMK